MNDHDIEQMLRRHRPAGPPPELRARVFQTAAVEARLWPWAVAAAALLVITVGFHVASASLGSQVPIQFESDDRERLVEALGGDDVARTRAELIMAERAVLTEELQR